MRISVSLKNNNVDFEPIEVNTLDELAKQAMTYNYSTGVFKGNYRNKANFLQAECIAIDVDNDDVNDNYTMEGARDLFKDYKHIIMPSKSHQKEKNGRVADRFRVILFLDSSITNAKDFTATWIELLKHYPAADRACKDASRFYYPSPSTYSINNTGKSWPVTQYVQPEVLVGANRSSDGPKGSLSRLTMEFLLLGAPAGKRHTRLFKASRDMHEQGIPLSECKERVQAMITMTANWGTTYLNDKDVVTIEDAYKDVPRYDKRDIPEESTSVFNFKTVSELIEEAGDIEWMVKDLLTTGGFSIIVGPPKAGKSTLVRQLIKSVCRGTSFLGRNVQEGKILYLTFEEQPSVLKAQFDKIGIKNDDPIVIHTGAVFDDRALEDLKEAILEYQPSLVVLDTLFDICQVESVNSYKEVKHALAQIRNIGRETGAHILGVHHINKSEGPTDSFNKIMGSQAIFGAVDMAIQFQQVGERRFLSSSGKYGVNFNKHEIVYNFKNDTYAVGNTYTTEKKF
jgi:hypothetical protein